MQRGAAVGLFAIDFNNGFDFELNGGKNFTIRNFDEVGILICGLCRENISLGDIEITGVIVENIACEGILFLGTNLESGSITNSEISSNFCDGVIVIIDACADDCLLTDSVLEISGNRIQGGTEATRTTPTGSVAGDCCVASGVRIEYDGTLNIDPDDVFSGVPIGGGTKITVSVSQNEVINGTGEGVTFDFFGCGQDAGVNVHVDENEEINGGFWDGVDVSIWADECFKLSGALAGDAFGVSPGNTSDGFDAVVTVNSNGDIESHGGDGPIGEAVTVNIFICCEGSDSSATVEVNDNGRLTGEDDGVGINTSVCCGDDNVSDVQVSRNDEITGEGDDGIEVNSFTGSNVTASSVAGGTGDDADDNTCTITVDGNNEVDGVGVDDDGGDGMSLYCFAGASGETIIGDAGLAGATSSGDGNVSMVLVTNNNNIDGDHDGVGVSVFAGSLAGEADDNLAVAVVSGNGEVTGDDDDGIEFDLMAGSLVDEGDDNATEVTVEANQEVGGNDGEGIEVDSFAGGVTAGSEGNSNSVTISQNGDIEGQGIGHEGIELDPVVCCDSENTNTVTISNNKGEITGHDDDGIEIQACCSINIITITDNEGNIRGGDDKGLELRVCSFETANFPAGFGSPAGQLSMEVADCLKHSVTHLTVINNSFSDSERDGINILRGAFEDESMGIKSVISNNIISGNGDDGIDIDSAWGLNIGPGNQIFNNGTSNNTIEESKAFFGTGDSGDSGIEIDWYSGACAWFDFDNKFAANHNTITQNSIYDNFSLGIDLVGFDPDDDFFSSLNGCSVLVDGGLPPQGAVGCDIFPLTAIAANDCIPFPELQTQSGDKLIGIACSECTVEVFWADDDPSNNDDADGVPHGEGAVYLVTGEADEDGSFSIELPCDLGPGDLTATATDKLKNTSEFSANLITLGTGSCATDTPVATDTPLATDTPVPTNTPVATDTPVPPTDTPVPPKVCGDVNEDGVANSVDASLVLQFKAGLISSLPNESSGDVNGDGSLTSVDAALLLQFTAGLIGEDGLNCG